MSFIHLPAHKQKLYDRLFDDDSKYGIRTTAKLEKPWFYSTEQPTHSIDETNLTVSKLYQSEVLCKIESNYSFHLVLSSCDYVNLKSVFDEDKNVHEFNFTKRGGNVPVGFNQFSTIKIKLLDNNLNIDDAKMKTYWTENDELCNFRELYNKPLYGNICLWKMDGSFYISNWDGFECIKH